MKELPARIKIVTYSSNEPKMTKIAQGTVTTEGEGFLVRYLEDPGSFQKTIAELVLQKEYMSLLRLGAFNNKLEFKPGCLLGAYYETPYGELHVETDTRELKMDLNEEERTINYMAKYRLSICGSKAEESDKAVFITVKILE